MRLHFRGMLSGPVSNTVVIVNSLPFTIHMYTLPTVNSNQTLSLIDIIGAKMSIIWGDFGDILGVRSGGGVPHLHNHCVIA